MRRKRRRPRRDPRPRRDQDVATPDHRTRCRAHPGGSEQARPRRVVHDRRQPRPQPLRPDAVLPSRHPQHEGDRRRGRPYSSRSSTCARRASTCAVDTLSGGNQQKVIVARELAGDVKVLFVAQPTRGLDVGSIEFIHKQIIALRDRGVAVLLVSAELDEILSLSDRIGVLYRGRLVGTFEGKDATREQLGFLMATGAISRLGGRPRRMNEPTSTPTGLAPMGLPDGGISSRSSIPLYALLLSFVVGGVLIALIGVNPFEAYWALLRGMFGSPERIAGSIARSVPFIGSALALAFAFRAGLFNIGAEGQLLIGGVTAAWVGTWSFMYDLPGILAVPIIIARRLRRRCAVGRDPRRPAGTHRRPRGDHTIMLNSIALFGTRWLINSTDPLILRDPTASVPRTKTISETARLPELVGSEPTLHTGLLVHGGAVRRRLVRPPAHDVRLRDDHRRHEPARRPLRRDQRQPDHHPRDGARREDSPASPPSRRSPARTTSSSRERSPFSVSTASRSPCWRGPTRSPSSPHRSCGVRSSPVPR